MAFVILQMRRRQGKCPLFVARRRLAAIAAPPVAAAAAACCCRQRGARAGGARPPLLSCCGCTAAAAVPSCFSSCMLLRPAHHGRCGSAPYSRTCRSAARRLLAASSCCLTAARPSLPMCSRAGNCGEHLTRCVCSPSRDAELPCSCCDAASPSVARPLAAPGAPSEPTPPPPPPPPPRPPRQSDPDPPAFGA